MIIRYLPLLILTSATVLIGCSSPVAEAAPATGNASPTAPVAALSTSELPPDSCPVTQPPDPPFDPPLRYPPVEGEFWYGTPELWTMLRNDGKWWALPYHSGGYNQKVFFWRAGYDMYAKPQPELTVSGRRLDGEAPPLIGSGRATNAYHSSFGQAMLTGVVIPTLGCWEITGHYRGHDLSFVVRVTP